MNMFTWDTRHSSWLKLLTFSGISPSFRAIDSLLPKSPKKSSVTKITVVNVFMVFFGRRDFFFKIFQNYLRKMSSISENEVSKAIKVRKSKAKKMQMSWSIRNATWLNWVEQILSNRNESLISSLNFWKKSRRSLMWLTSTAVVRWTKVKFSLFHGDRTRGDLNTLWFQVAEFTRSKIRLSGFDYVVEKAGSTALITNARTKTTLSANLEHFAEWLILRVSSLSLCVQIAQNHWLYTLLP